MGGPTRALRALMCVFSWCSTTADVAMATMTAIVRAGKVGFVSSKASRAPLRLGDLAFHTFCAELASALSPQSSLGVAALLSLLWRESRTAGPAELCGFSPVARLRRSMCRTQGYRSAVSRASKATGSSSGRQRHHERKASSRLARES